MHGCSGSLLRYFQCRIYGFVPTRCSMGSFALTHCSCEIVLESIDSRPLEGQAMAAMMALMLRSMDEDDE